jgi:hypothetical protein
MANMITTTNAKTDAIRSLRGDTTNRNQTVFTPRVIVDAVTECFGGRIAFDPCYAPGSLTDPFDHCELSLDAIRERAKAFADLLAPDPETAREAVEIVCDGKPVGKSSKEAAAVAKTVITSVRNAFRDASGHNHERWKHGTFINPPYADRGPEVIVANFRDFCKAFAATSADVIMLCPARTHRAWWRRDVLLSGSSIAWLDVFAFEGHKQSFPAPCVLAYRGRHHDRFAEAMANMKLGCEVTRIPAPIQREVPPLPGWVLS